MSIAAKRSNTEYGVGDGKGSKKNYPSARSFVTSAIKLKLLSNLCNRSDMVSMVADTTKGAAVMHALQDTESIDEFKGQDFRV